MSKELAFEREASKFIDNKTASEINLQIARLSDSMKDLEKRLVLLEVEIKQTINDKPGV